MEKDKLIDLQKEYIKLLEKALSESNSIAAIHGYMANKDDIKKGELLREEIAKCVNTLNESDKFDKSIAKLIEAGITKAVAMAPVNKPKN